MEDYLKICSFKNNNIAGLPYLVITLGGIRGRKYTLTRNRLLKRSPLFSERFSSFLSQYPFPILVEKALNYNMKSCSARPRYLFGNKIV